MNTLINKEHKHLLWKDEINFPFLLLRYAEVYRYSKDTLRLFVFMLSKLPPLRKLGVIQREERTDDNIVIIDVKTQDLPVLIQLGQFKKRPHIHGRWIKDKEKRLGHRIIPYRPVLSKRTQS